MDEPITSRYSLAGMLHLEWLEGFTVFAEHLSFTAAARALHLSQPALHVQIGKLSAELGVPLYVRHGQRLELTADGRRVLLFAREMGERERAFRDVLRAGESLQPVAFAAGEGSFLYLLGPAIRAFSAAARAPLRLLTRDLDATLAAVRSGEAHLGVAPVDGAPQGLTIDHLTEVAQVLAVPAAHPLARRRSIKLRDLEGARLIVPPPGRPHRAALTAALLAAGVAWEPAVEASGWEPCSISSRSAWGSPSSTPAAASRAGSSRAPPGAAAADLQRDPAPRRRARRRDRGAPAGAPGARGRLAKPAAPRGRARLQARSS